MREGHTILKLAVHAATCFFAALAGMNAQDAVHLKNGETLDCRIEAITDNILTYQTSVDLGGGRSATARRTISPDFVDFIEFAALPGESENLADPGALDLKKIEAVWFEISRHLHRPRSNAGRIGLAYANALLNSEKEYEWDQALALFDRIREQDWNPENHQAAFQGRLRTLIQIGDLETALHEAKQLAEQSEDPGMLIEAKYALARVDFEALKELEEENPKWEEDDTVRPDRNRLYHRTVDQFLWPYLFYGTREESAARGLMAASDVYQFSGDKPAARACLADIEQLYPNTRIAAEAREKLKDFQTIENDEKKNPN